MALSDLNRMIYAALLDIKMFGPKDKTLGICANVGKLLGDAAELDDDLDEALLSLFESWPDKSSSSAYPVGKWILFPRKLFWHHYDNTSSMWEQRTRYGQARWDLLEHCIKRLS